MKTFLMTTLLLLLVAPSVLAQESVTVLTLASGDRVCGKVQDKRAGSIDIAVQPGLIRTVARRDIRRIVAARSCREGAPTTADIPDVVLHPPMQARQRSGHWSEVALGGVIGSGMGLVVGGVTGYALERTQCTPGGFLNFCGLTGAALGGGVGTVVGSALGANIVGQAQHRRGMFAASLGGALLGAGFGLILVQPSYGFSIPLGAGLGATAGYMLSDSSRGGSLSYVPTQGGGYVTYGASF